MAVIKMNFLSRMLGMQTNVTAIIPTLNFQDAVIKKDVYYHIGMKYQVLYLLHGYSGDDSDYVNFSNILRYAEEKKLAVVMPSGYNSQYTDSEGASQYFRYITEELPLVMEATFPISAERKDRFIGGLSMGAHGAMKCAIYYPEKYSHVILMSGAIQDDRNLQMLPMEVDITHGLAGMIPIHIESEEDDPWIKVKENAEKGLELPKFLITCGNEDKVLGNCKYAADFLIKNNYAVDTEWVDGYAHEWDFWDISLKKAIYDWLPLIDEPILR